MCDVLDGVCVCVCECVRERQRDIKIDSKIAKIFKYIK